MTKVIKKCTALLACLLILISCLNTLSVKAKAEEPIYTESELIKRFFMMHEEGNSIRFLIDNKNHYFRKTINNIWSNESDVAGIYVASGLAKRPIDEKRAVNLLVALINQFDISFDEAIDTQNQYDTKKSFMEYSEDVINVATSLLGSKYETTTKIFGLTVDTTDLVIDSFEEYEVYSKTLINYERHMRFLDSIERNSRQETLIAAAKKLKHITNEALLYKLEQFNKVGGDAVRFSAKDVFFDSVFTQLINDNQLELFKGEDYEDAINSLVDVNEKLGDIEGVLEGIASGGVLIGDILVGTTNTTNRIIEMYLLTDIYQCLFITFTDSLSNGLSLELDGIMQALPYLDMMTYVILRGEYCNSKLYEEGGLIGNLNYTLKNQVQNNYNEQVLFIRHSSNQIKRLRNDILAHLDKQALLAKTFLFGRPADENYFYELDYRNSEQRIFDIYLTRTNLKTWQKEDIFDFTKENVHYWPEELTLFEGYLYFIESNGVFKMNVDGGEFQKIGDHKIKYGTDLIRTQFLVNENGIYYHGVEESLAENVNWVPYYFHMTLDGKVVTKISSVEGLTRQLTYAHGKFFFLKTDGVYSMDIDGSNLTHLVNANIDFWHLYSSPFVVSEDRLIFATLDDFQDRIVSTALDGTDAKTIHDGFCSYFYLNENRLFINKPYVSDGLPDYENSRTAYLDGKAYILAIYDLEAGQSFDTPIIYSEEKSLIAIVDNQMVFRTKSGEIKFEEFV